MFTLDLNLVRIGGAPDDPAFVGVPWAARPDDVAPGSTPAIVVLDAPADGAAALAAVRGAAALADAAILALVGPADAEAPWLEDADAALVRPVASATLRSTLRLLARTASDRADKRKHRHEAVLASMDEGFCVFEMLFDDAGRPVDYRFVEVNAAFERHTGLRDAAGRRIRELAPAHEQSWFDLYGQVALTGESIRVSGVAAALEGRSFEVRAFRIGAPAERLVAALFADVGDRRRAEVALIDSQRRLRTITDHMPALVAHVDAQQRYTFANAAYERLLGQPASAMVGSTIREVIGAAAYDLRRPQIEATLGSGQSVQFEARFPLAAAGELFTLTTYLPERDAEGRVSGFYIFALDITARVRAERALRESEARFRTIADAMPQIVWVTRPNGDHEYYNRRWYDYVGVAPGETDGDRWATVLHADDQARARARWRRSLDTGEPYEIEYRLRRGDGAYRWFLGLALPARDEAGGIVQWHGTCTDIDDQRRLRDERDRLLQSERAARADAERAGRVKDEFLATLSHELRTPLSAMLGWSQVLQRSTKPDDIRAGLVTIERNARAQSQIIEDLLDMSRIVGGKIRLEVQPVDLAAVCSAAIDTVRPAADGREIRIQPVLDPHAGPVNGDPARLQQVLWNLLSNAVKFTPKGGRVGVVLARVNSHVEVRVSDTGEGIAAAFLPFVFDRFRQADGTSTRRHGGLGLGLSICKQLVELHGGTIRVDSGGTGAGSTFTVALPLNAVHPSPHDERRHPRAAPATPDVASDPDADLTGLRLLVVDDEPDARDLASRVLTDRGAIVTLARSAAEALERLNESRFDLLVSDVGMPDVDGHGLIRRLRALPADRGGATPAIALTAYATADDRVRALTAGFQMHLSKPVEPSELIAAAAAMARRTTRDS